MAGFAILAIVGVVGIGVIAFNKRKTGLVCPRCHARSVNKVALGAPINRFTCQSCGEEWVEKAL